MTEIFNLSTLCRCCHADGHFKSLSLPYQGENDVEIYEEMLRGTLGIIISTPPVEASYTICDDCIFKLRDAVDFKKQVLQSEEKFQFYCNNEQFSIPVDIKSEGESNLDHDDTGGVVNRHEFNENITPVVKKEYNIEFNTSDPVQEDHKKTEPKSEKIEEDIKEKCLPKPEELKKNNSNTRKRKINKNKEKTKGEKQTVEDIKEKSSQIPKQLKKNNSNAKRRKITKNKEKTEGEKQTKDVKEKCSKIPKELKKNNSNTKRKKRTKKKEKTEGEECKNTVNLDESIIIKVETDTGTKYSCKTCSGIYETKKETDQHIFEAHPLLYKCEYCEKQLENSQTYIEHLKQHKNNQCKFCPRTFAFKTSLDNHLLVHTQEKRYECDICQKTLRAKINLIKHLRIHAGTNKRVLCHICGWTFTDEANLRAHTQTVHEKLRPFQCEICKKTFSNKRHHKDHLKLHSGDAHEKVYKCDVCDYKLFYEKSMRIHRLRHDGKYMCNYCPQIFESTALKLNHIKTVHKKGVICTICGKGLADQHSLNRHMDVHNGVKYPCKICGSKFGQISVLKRHVKRAHETKTDVNPVKTKCQICKRSFINITVHMDRHFNKPCACEICGKTYPTNGSLNRHKGWKHFGKTVDCDICGKKYYQKAKLNTHKFKVHKIKIEKVSEKDS